LNTKTEVRVDLTNCDREPIHLLGKVQNFGFLLGINADWDVVYLSANAGDFLENLSSGVLGQPADKFIPFDTLHAIRNRLQPLDSGPGAQFRSCLRIVSSHIVHKL